MADDSAGCFRAPETVEDPLTELLRSAERQLLQQAAELLARYEGRKDAAGSARRTTSQMATELAKPQ